MQEFVVTAPRTINFREYDEPALKPTEVRVKLIVSGIKHGTEMTLYRGQTPFLTRSFDPEYRMFMPRDENRIFYPINLGSWAVGEVIEAGAAVTQFKVGNLVHGEMKHKPTNVFPADKLFPLKPGMKPEHALFTDPTIYALGAVHDAEIKVGDRVAIFGMGALGLLAVQVARLSGAETIFAVDTMDNRLELAKQFGADAVFNARTTDPALEIRNATNKKGVDVVIEISGAYPALQNAIRAVHVSGLIVTAGYYNGLGSLELGGEWHHNRPTIKSSMPVWGNQHRSSPMWDIKRTEQTALRLIENGKVNVETMIGRRYNYADALEAYKFIDEHPEDTLKTLLDY